MKNLYRVLGVSPSAMLEQVRDAYRKLAQAHHPDRPSLAKAPPVPPAGVSLTASKPPVEGGEQRAPESAQELDLAEELP